MRLKNIPLNRSIGAILIHNIVDANGQRVFAKGRVVSSADVEKIRALGKESIYVALLDANDVR